MNKKKFLALCILMLSIIAGFSGAVLAAEQHNTICPVMTGERTKDKFYVDWNGRKIYMCCRSCVRKFKKNPEKYLKNLERADAGQAETA